jgi:hypothetical protein
MQQIPQFEIKKPYFDSHHSHSKFTQNVQPIEIPKGRGDNAMVKFIGQRLYGFNII